MRFLRVRQVCLFAALFVGAPIAVRAQARPVVPDSLRQNLVLVNPLAVIFNVYSAEYERVLTRAVTAGVDGTYYGLSGGDYSTADVKLRYYPQEHALSGFSLAATAGFARVTGEVSCDSYNPYNGACIDTARNYPTIGIELDYNWLLGPSRRFGVGTGIGAKRLIGTRDEYSGLSALPTGRLSVGLAF